MNSYEILFKFEAKKKDHRINIHFVYVMVEIKIQPNLKFA